MHERHALKAGITPEQIQRIKAGVAPGFDDPTEALTWELAAALHGAGSIDADLYRRCMAVFGHAGVSNLIGLAGLYSMIAMTLNFYDVPPPQEPAGTAGSATPAA